MILDIWKRSQRDTDVVIEIPSYKVVTIFELNSGKIIGRYSNSKTGESGWLLQIQEEECNRVLKILKDLKDKGMVLED